MHEIAASAWTWAATEAEQAKVVVAAASAGLARLNIMVNGLGPTLARPDRMYLNGAGETLERFAGRAFEAGLGVDLTYWPTRHPRHVDASALELVPRLEWLRELEARTFPSRGRVARLFVDVEDPWYESKRLRGVSGLVSAEDAAALWAERFASVQAHTVGSGIGYVPRSAAVLVEQCRFAEPQAYALTVPRPRTLLERWRRRFGAAAVESCALRLYRINVGQLEAALASSAAAGVSEVTYWDARSLGRLAVRRFRSRQRRPARLAA